MRLVPNKAKYALARWIGDVIEKRAKRILRETNVWEPLQAYLAESPSTGCSYSDYLLLYKYIREKKPKHVLECGTGVSTVVIAQALKENHLDGGGSGKVTSLEESASYHSAAVKIFPKALAEYADILLSPVVEDTYNFFRGVRYKDIPDLPYEFVLVDGPDHLVNPTRPIVAFNFDLLWVIERSKQPVSALIDTRISTCFVYSIILGKKFSFDYLRRVGVVEQCAKKDILSAQEIGSRALKRRAFARPSLRKFVFGQYE